MPSFDIVSELNMAEVDNAVNQASKELSQRYDFRGTLTTVKRDEKTITLDSSEEYKVNAAWDVLQSKFVKRHISLKSIKVGKVEAAAKGRQKLNVELLEGIDKDHAKDLVKKIKDKKLKVQPSIQGESVRVSGKKRDDLQDVIAACEAFNFSLPLQFVNFRD